MRVAGVALRSLRAGVLVCAGLVAGASDADEPDGPDWTDRFFANCDLPRPVAGADGAAPSVSWERADGARRLRVSVRPGDVGRCHSDDRPRDGAPFWERVELRQSDSLPDGVRSTITFDATFREGFTGKRETFFQLHGWSKTCRSAPLAMLQFDWRTLKVLLLQPEAPGTARPGLRQRGALFSALPDAPPLSALKGGAHRFELSFDARERPYKVGLAVDGDVLLPPTEIHAEPCATPRIKIGIYRPGRLNPAPSEILIGDLRIATEGKRLAAN